jgi:hypothetical protein
LDLDAARAGGVGGLEHDLEALLEAAGLREVGEEDVEQGRDALEEEIGLLALGHGQLLLAVRRPARHP